MSSGKNTDIWSLENIFRSCDFPCPICTKKYISLGKSTDTIFQIRFSYKIFRDFGRRPAVVNVNSLSNRATIPHFSNQMSEIGNCAP